VVFLIIAFDIEKIAITNTETLPIMTPLQHREREKVNMKEI